MWSCDADISSNNFKMYQQRKKKMTNHASILLDVAHLNLICRDVEVPVLDLTSGEDPPLNLISEE